MSQGTVSRGRERKKRGTQGRQGFLSQQQQAVALQQQRQVRQGWRTGGVGRWGKVSCCAVSGRCSWIVVLLGALCGACVRSARAAVSVL